MPDMRPRYLGDGLYCQLDPSGQIKLYTWDGIDITNEVYLDDQVLDAFLKWLKDIREQVLAERGSAERKKDDA